MSSDSKAIDFGAGRVAGRAGRLAAAGLCFLAAACHFHEPRALGNAQLQNRAVQVVEPEPAVPYYPPNFNGPRAVLAIGRYYTGQTVPIDEQLQED